MNNLKGLQKKLDVRKNDINTTSGYGLATCVPVLLQILKVHDIYVPPEFFNRDEEFYFRPKFLYWIQQVLKMDITYETPTAVFVSAYNWQTEDDYGIGQNLDLAILRCALHFAYGTI